VEQVWECIAQAPTEPHPAYALGMSRLSCAFCILASRRDLQIAAEHNPELLAEYVRIEAKIGHTFRKDASIVQLTRRPR